MKRDIVVVGSSNTDMILRVPHVPAPGETVLGGEFSMAAGGKGANQAVAAARAGGSVAFVARVGKDMFGDRAIRGFEAAGIDTTCVRRDESASSGVALIFVGRDGENCIGVAPGANGRLSPSDIAEAEELIPLAGIILMQLEIPMETIESVIRLAQRRGARVILDPAPAQPLSDNLLRGVSIITPNETEAEILTGMKVDCLEGARAAAEALAGKGVETVIVTLGSRGAFVLAPGIRETIPALHVKAVDTTAAGDTFNGALAAALSEGRPLSDAVLFANAAAAISVTRPGAQPSAPSRAEIDAWLLRDMAADSGS